MAKKQKKNKKWISWVIILILFVAAAAVAYLVWDAYFRDKNDDQGETSGGQMEVVENKASETTAEVEDVVEKPKTVQYDGEDPNELEELSGAVTHAGVAGDNLMIRVNIDQYLEEGSCELELARDGATIYNSMTGIVGNVATATCEGFDVPVSEVGGGEFEIIINLDAGGKVGVIRGEVSI